MPLLILAVSASTKAQELTTFTSGILPNFRFQYNSNLWSLEEKLSSSYARPVYVIQLSHSGTEGFLRINFELPVETGWDSDEESSIPVNKLGFAQNFVRIPSAFVQDSYYYLPKSFVKSEGRTEIPYPLQVPLVTEAAKDYVSEISSGSYWGRSKPAIWFFINLETKNQTIIKDADLVVASLEFAFCQDYWICDKEK